MFASHRGRLSPRSSSWSPSSSSPSYPIGLTACLSSRHSVHKPIFALVAISLFLTTGTGTAFAENADPVDYGTTQIWAADKDTPQPAPVNGEEYVAKEATFVVNSSTAKGLLRTVHGAKGVGAHVSAPLSDILSVSLQCLNDGRLKARVGVRVWYLPSQGIEYGAGTPHSPFQALTCATATTTTTTTQPTPTATTPPAVPSTTTTTTVAPSAATTTTTPGAPSTPTTTTTVPRTTTTIAASPATTPPDLWTTTTTARPATTTTVVAPVTTTTAVAVPPSSQFPAGVREMVEGLPGWGEVVFRSGTCTAGARGNVTATYQRGNPPVICFSSGLLDDSWNRRRFIAAHELAHHFLWDLGGYDLAKNESLADCLAEHWTDHNYRDRCSESDRERVRQMLSQSSSSSTGRSESARGAGPDSAVGSSNSTAATTTTIPSPPATINPRVSDLIAAGELGSGAVVEGDNRVIVVNDYPEPEATVDQRPSVGGAPDERPGAQGRSAAPAGPMGGAPAAGAEAEPEPEPLSGVFQALLFGITLGMFRGYGPLQRLFAPEEWAS